MNALQPAFSPDLRGDVVLPGDARYDELRRVHNAMADKRPAAIVRARTTEDVAATIAHARARGLPLAIRGGGHSVAGHGVVEGGIVLDTRAMRDVVVDPAAMTLRASAGTTWAELDAAGQVHAMAVTGARTPGAGVVGVTLGSGSGWLERAMGLASDNLVAARLVTAEGREVVATPCDHPELLWALRGGGGNFGVVTEMTFKAMGLGPKVAGGLRLYPVERAGEVLRAYAQVLEDAPDELSGGLALMTAPDLPAVPEALRGRPVVGVLALWAGELAESLDGLAALDALGAPLADLVRPTPYATLQALFDQEPATRTRSYLTFGVADALTDGALDTLVRLGEELEPGGTVLLQPLGGAFRRVGDGSTALGDRTARWGVQVLSVWSARDRDAGCVAWTRAAAAELADHLRPSSWPNMVPGGERGPAVAYAPDTLSRLLEVKRAWDPDNVFRVNHNLVP